MKIIKPEKSIESIISLIENAKEFVVIVSPFNDLTGWDKLIKVFNLASERKVRVMYFVREGEGFNGIEELKVDVFEVPMLHAKMFFSENEAIISSGNLTSRPDINWFCRLNADEYEQTSHFFDSYIKTTAKKLSRTRQGMSKILNK